MPGRTAGERVALACRDHSTSCRWRDPPTSCHPRRTTSRLGR